MAEETKSTTGSYSIYFSLALSIKSKHFVYSFYGLLCARCAVGFRCEIGRNGVLCLHDLLLHLKSECSEEINSNGSHFMRLYINSLDYNYGFTQQHYNDVVPSGARMSIRLDELETHGNIVISRNKGYNQRTMAVTFIKDDSDIKSSHIPWDLFPSLERPNEHHTMEDAVVMACTDEMLQAPASEEAQSTNYFPSERLWGYCEDENDENSFSLNIQLIEIPIGSDYKEPFFVILDSFLIALDSLRLTERLLQPWEFREKFCRNTKYEQVVLHIDEITSRSSLSVSSVITLLLQLLSSTSDVDSSVNQRTWNFVAALSQLRAREESSIQKTEKDVDTILVNQASQLTVQTVKKRYLARSNPQRDQDDLVSPLLSGSSGFSLSPGAMEDEVEDEQVVSGQVVIFATPSISLAMNKTARDISQLLIMNCTFDGKYDAPMAARIVNRVMLDSTKEMRRLCLGNLMVLLTLSVEDNFIPLLDDLMVSLKSIKTMSERSWDSIICKIFNNFLESIGIDPSLAHVVETKAIKKRIQRILDSFGLVMDIRQVPYKKYPKLKKDSNIFILLQET